jgi:transcriptional regulator with XRE-family HTH domain
MENVFKLHEVIQSLRKQRGITQEELAGHFNISNQAVSKWESGQSCPDITLLPRLASFFGVSVDELLGTSPVCSSENLYLNIRSLFEVLPEEELFKTAFNLSALLHEALCTKGFKEPVPWPIRNRLSDNGYTNWGFSSVSETEGISIMTAGLTVTGYLPDMKFPDNSGLRKIFSTLSKLNDRDMLKILFSIHEQTYSDNNIWTSVDDISKLTSMPPEKVQAIIEKLITYDFVEEKHDKVTGYRITGAFASILPVLIVFSGQ